ncbi:hypothetical protein [Salegentibacter salarius]|uniref:Uncharacterized protein n=1 Tax=Salegentibacter salarius TaxID=435906 RepID=A0A2N0TX01_9FLAO|nr:hypothetical protein [Salegentibacter salarius]OEY72813.1 hypothetical protein BHS39_11255 [Salegentibacter salarius]PKD19273.1 hypothetical protein APR40_11235 [Salegentibacter salarius]SLJ99907.1 hypothetical protein SAMN05660445_02296 [Salegentibacter salarius]
MNNDTKTTGLIRVNDKINLRTSGDISKIPSNDKLFSKSFLQYNNNLIAKNYEKNQETLFDILKTVPGVANIISSVGDKGRYIADLTKKQAEKINSGEWEFVKAKDGSGLKAILRDAKNKNFKGQANITLEDVSPAQMQNLLNATQMLMIQQAITQVSKQIEYLDEKVSDVLYGAQNDRLAYIQSGYNLFLQAQASEEIKKTLYPIMIGQLNLGREQLIYSLQYTLKKISDDKTGKAAFWDEFTSWGNKREANEARINEIKQSLSFVIRSTQLLAIIYQDNNEHWSMMQSILRLKELLNHFQKAEFEFLGEWSASEREIQSLRKGIVETRSAIHQNISVLMENPTDIKLQLKTEFHD